MALQPPMSCYYNVATDITSHMYITIAVAT